MKRLEGIHFYINIKNLNDVILDEEKKGDVVHSIHALDTYFSSIEAFGKKHFPDTFVVEKITGSRLHMYVLDEIGEAFNVVAEVVGFAGELTRYINENISKYKTLMNFEIQAGACYGHFYNFEFKRENADEETTIGYAANYAAKLQGLSSVDCISISSNIYEYIDCEYRKRFVQRQSAKIGKYDQYCYYETIIANLKTSIKRADELEQCKNYANQLNLSDMNFRNAMKPLTFDELSKKECKKVEGIPLFADVRGFTNQFDKEDANLEEMAEKTQNILASMYEVVEKQDGIHVQFQGDREFALFHDYPGHECCLDAVVAGLKIIDTVKEYQVSVGVGQSLGEMFAAKIGARGEKDYILVGSTVIAADYYEDEMAEKNQLVISKNIYNYLQTRKPRWAQMFKRLGECYCTTWGYKSLINEVSRTQLQNNNQQKNYNGAWGE
ncbi:MAG: hypothetical protein IJE23_06515 [Tyzzerella sp.]|nr:hypothetical protein [Tyzzerella sp.]